MMKLKNTETNLSGSYAKYNTFFSMQLFPTKLHMYYDLQLLFAPSSSLKK